jgi:hypothetical protein
MLTPAEVTRGLRRLHPGVNITTTASPAHRGAVVIAMPGTTCYYGDRRWIASLLRAATGVTPEVVDVQEMAPHVTRAHRYRITARFAT